MANQFHRTSRAFQELISHHNLLNIPFRIFSTDTLGEPVYSPFHPFPPPDGQLSCTREEKGGRGANLERTCIALSVSRQSPLGDISGASWHWRVQYQPLTRIRLPRKPDAALSCMRSPRNCGSGLNTGFSPWSGWKLSISFTHIHMTPTHRPTFSALELQRRSSSLVELPGQLGGGQAPLLPLRGRSAKTNLGSYQSDGWRSLSWFLGLTGSVGAHGALTPAHRDRLISYGPSGPLAPVEVASPGSQALPRWQRKWKCTISKSRTQAAN